MLSQVDHSEAATRQLLDEVVLLLDVAVVRVDEPAAAAIVRGSIVVAAASHRRNAQATPRRVIGAAVCTFH